LPNFPNSEYASLHVKYDIFCNNLLCTFHFRKRQFPPQRQVTTLRHYGISFLNWKRNIYFPLGKVLAGVFTNTCASQLRQVTPIAEITAQPQASDYSRHTVLLSFCTPLTEPSPGMKRFVDLLRSSRNNWSRTKSIKKQPEPVPRIQIRLKPDQVRSSPAMNIQPLRLHVQPCRCRRPVVFPQQRQV
jgi:hypothetical protein